MSVSTTNSTQTFAGGQSVLTFNFRALTSFPQYIQVSAVALTGGTVTALSYSTQYTVTVSTTGVGGTVIVSPTFGTNYNYVVYRSTAILQSSAYTDYNAFPASTLENNLDQLTMIDQEASTDRSLQLSFPIGTSTTYSTTMPIPSIGTVIGTDPTGTEFINLPPAPSGATGAIGPSGATGNITLVSSSTSDITMVSTSTTPIITAVNAATAGANTILRLNSFGFVQPTTISGLVGAQTVMLSTGTAYLAATDGMVEVYSLLNTAGNGIFGKTDSSPTPSTIVMAQLSTSTNTPIGMSFIVKKGNSYLVSIGSVTIAGYSFTPLSN